MNQIPELHLISTLTKQQVAAGEEFSQKGSLLISLRKQTSKSLPANIILIFSMEFCLRKLYS